MNRILLYMLVTLSVITACNPGPDYSDVPTLTFKGMSKDTMNQGTGNGDFITVTLGFTDGDGDIAIVQDGEVSLNLVVTDNRTGFDYAKFQIPEIPASGINNGISGDIQILLFQACCVYPPESQIPNCAVTEEFPTNELIWGFTLTDNAGNVSNTTFSNPISLKCR